MILKEELNKNNRQVEEIYVHITKEKYVYEIATDNVRLRKENIERNMLNLFSSYENHIIWRYLNLNILPDDKKEKNIITRYLNTVFPNLENEKISFDIIYENIKSIVDFEKILTVEEAIARSIYENKKKEKKKKEELFDDYNEENLEKNNKKSLFSNIFNKFNKNVDENDGYELELETEKEKFLDINKQDEDLENYILEENSGLWDEEHVEWIDDIDSLEDSIKEKNEKKVKKDKTEEKGLFD
jgi:hypothetical protein